MKPRIAFVVQRCGKEVNGGAEALCLAVAQHMQQQWDVEIVTTCAVDYMTWQDHYPEGVQTEEGVPIRRFRVDQQRDLDRFNATSRVLAIRPGKASLAQAEDWMKLQGPVSSRLLEYLSDHAGDFDAFIFFTYLYATTYFGLPLVQQKAYLMPAAHDEWPIYLPMWDDFMEKPRAFIFNTAQEKAFTQKRFPHARLNGEIAGVGVTVPERCSKDDFMRKYAIQDPYILYIGRIDESKGCRTLLDYFMRYKQEAPGGLKLVLAGKAVMTVPQHHDIIELGFVDEQTKFDALDGCTFLVNPSPYESLSIVLLEAWSLNKPVLVNAAAEVMVEQCRRSNGGLWYENYEEFHACLNFLLRHPGLAGGGREFVQGNYSWDAITKKYAALIAL